MPTSVLRLLPSSCLPALAHAHTRHSVLLTAHGGAGVCTVVLALGSRSQVLWRCSGPEGIWEGILPGWIVQQRVAVCEEPRCRRADLWWCCCIGVTVEALGGFFTCPCLHQQVTVPHTLLETCCCSKQRHVAPTAAHSTSRLAARLLFTPQETRTSTSFLHHVSPGSYEGPHTACTRLHIAHHPHKTLRERASHACHDALGGKPHRIPRTSVRSLPLSQV